MTPFRKIFSRGPLSAVGLTLVGCAVLLLAGCTRHLELPSTEEPLPHTAKSAAPSKLRFKALLLDENGNLYLESGEPIRVRVEIVNTGPSPIQNASASLTGTPSVIKQFQSTTLTIPPLQPGETQSLEFAATLPSSLQPQQVEIRVSVTESGGAAARPQALLFIIQPAGAASNDVDHLALVSYFRQPQA